MFQNDFLDFFTRTPWWTVPLIWGPVSAGLLAWGVLRQGAGPLAAAGAFAVGAAIWTLTEYGLHRTLFHWEPRTRWGPRLHFFVHGVHHDWPDDPYRLVIPPMIGLIPAILLFLPFWFIAGPVLSGPAFAGFLAGYIAYDCTHYAVHHFRLTSRWGRRLRAHHMNHHFNNPHRKFGVSSMFWDRVFGTL